MAHYVGRYVLTQAGNRVVYVLPKVSAEGPAAARELIFRTVSKLKVCGVWLGKEIAWLPSRDVLRWWGESEYDVVEAPEGMR